MGSTSLSSTHWGGGKCSMFLQGREGGALHRGSWEGLSGRLLQVAGKAMSVLWDQVVVWTRTA